MGGKCCGPETSKTNGLVKYFQTPKNIIVINRIYHVAYFVAVDSCRVYLDVHHVDDAGVDLQIKLRFK